MGEAAKKELGAELDLQEPVTALLRLEPRGPLEGHSHRHVDAVGDTIPMGALLVRLGDKALIEGALRGPRPSQPRAWSHAREFASCMEDMPTIILCEAMGMADLWTLNLGKEVFDAIEPNSFDRKLDLASWGGRSAVENLARHADAHGYEKVKACSQWALDRHDEQAAAMFIGAAEKGPKGAASRRMLAQASKSGRRALLTMAAARGSEKLAAAAIELGAKPGYGHAVRAADEGAYELALSLWKAAAGIEKSGKSNPLDSGFDQDSRGSWKGKGKESGKERGARCNALGMLADRCGRLVGELLPKKGFGENFVRKWFESHKKDPTDLFMHALLERPCLADEDDFDGQRALLKAVMAAAPHWADPQSVVSSLRAAYPLPMPEELAALAEARDWPLLGQRLGDALKAGADAPWRKKASEAVLWSFDQERAEKGQMTCSRQANSENEKGELGSRWSVRFAVEMSLAPLGWDGDLPIHALMASERLSKDKADEVFRIYESKAMEKAAPNEGKTSPSSRRI